LDVPLPDADDVAGLVEADVGAEDLLGVLEHLQRGVGHRGERGHAVVAAHDPARLAGAAGADGVALADHDVGDAAAGERPRGGAPLEAAADDDHVGGPVAAHRSAPGIQLVPARGTRAIAAASTVSATRSSGSRCSRWALPQARA